jgi:hypothetical protein
MHPPTTPWMSATFPMNVVSRRRGMPRPATVRPPDLLLVRADGAAPPHLSTSASRVGG